MTKSPTTRKKADKEQANYQFVPELGGLPVLSAQFKHQCFSRHVHEGYCIGIIEQGAQRFYRSGGNHIASENCIILVNADQVHDGQTATEGGWHYKALYPVDSMLSDIVGEYRGGATMPLFKAPVVSDRPLAQQLRQLFSIIASGEDQLTIKTSYYALMSRLLENHACGYMDQNPASKSKKVASQICDYLNDNLHCAISTDELSTLTGLNPYYLIRSFQKTTGLPPHAWQNQQRLRKATALLKSGFSATDAGLSVGFNDQSHFNRHFLRMWGTTPGRFQKAWKAQYC